MQIHKLIDIISTKLSFICGRSLIKKKIKNDEEIVIIDSRKSKKDAFYLLKVFQNSLNPIQFIIFRTTSMVALIKIALSLI